MKNGALAPLSTIMEMKKNALNELRARHTCTQILLAVLVCIAISALVAFAVYKLVQKLECDEYDIYDDDFDDMDDMEFDEHDVLADDGDFVK